ncbi:restriction endonuclease subunit S [Streptomyces sp. NEAU-H22]|uniref:restriction endonuclease subunit S n=1 Tax=Streptomyces sp. NEAU-H22 TaxID=2994655 RepID=UPI0022582324|nr:restriction endonuclease subunit S [Streptomyces sp. NEAU-H22]MCX3286835.1 restriction endonuclease subunit S [Streptomyces sp. NEAU-H22]
MTLSADGWIHGAPLQWTRGRIKNLIASSTNGTWGGEPAEDGSDVRCIRAADFDRVGRRAKTNGAPLRSIDASSLRQHLLHPGDLILEKSGGGEKQPVGMAVLYEGEEKAVCSNFCSRISPASDVESRFLTYVFAAAYGQGLTQSAIKQTTGIQNLDAGVLFSSPWAYPGLEEQRRIADFLDAETARIDHVSQLRERQKALLGARRWSHFQAELDRIPGGTLPLRRVIRSIIDGPFGSAFSSDAYLDEGAAVVRLGNIGFADYRGGDQARIPMALFERFRYHEVKSGDILIAGLGDSRNHAGRACVAPDDLGAAIVKGKCFRARVEKERADANFIALLLSSPVGASAVEGRGSTRSMINLEIVKSALLPIPSLARQRQLVTVHRKSWRQTKAAMSACDRQMALLAERRQALITAAVTGQFDVSTASGRNVTDGVTA